MSLENLPTAAVKKPKKNIEHLRVITVLNMRGESLRPCTKNKATSLLKQGKAKLVQPKVIQLLVASGQNKTKAQTSKC